MDTKRILLIKQEFQEGKISFYEASLKLVLLGLTGADVEKLLENAVVQAPKQLA
jgi:hypothetical protein